MGAHRTPAGTRPDFDAIRQALRPRVVRLRPGEFEESLCPHSPVPDAEWPTPLTSAALGELFEEGGRLSPSTALVCAITAVEMVLPLWSPDWDSRPPRFLDRPSTLDYLQTVIRTAKLALSEQREGHPGYMCHAIRPSVFGYHSVRDSALRAADVLCLTADRFVQKMAMMGYAREAINWAAIAAADSDADAEIFDQLAYNSARRQWLERWWARCRCRLAWADVGSHNVSGRSVGGMIPADFDALPIASRLREVTKQVLDEMRAEGLDPVDAEILPEWPTVWDIGCGWCERWAELAQAAVGGEAVWIEDLCEKLDLSPEELDELGECSHKVLKLNGLYYDADVPEGVASLWGLPLVQGNPRPVRPGIRLYRASDGHNDHVLSAWSPDIDTARAYLNNPGFGGSQLFTVVIPNEGILDLTDSSRRPFARLAEAVAPLLKDAEDLPHGLQRELRRESDLREGGELEESDIEQALLGWWGGRGYDHAYKAWENESWLLQLLGKHFSWLKHDFEDFPEGATTFVKLDDAELDEEEVEGSGAVGSRYVGSRYAEIQQGLKPRAHRLDWLSLSRALSPCEMPEDPLWPTPTDAVTAVNVLTRFSKWQRAVALDELVQLVWPWYAAEAEAVERLVRGADRKKLVQMVAAIREAARSGTFHDEKRMKLLEPFETAHAFTDVDGMPWRAGEVAWVVANAYMHLSSLGPISGERLLYSLRSAEAAVLFMDVTWIEAARDTPAIALHGLVTETMIVAATRSSANWMELKIRMAPFWREWWCRVRRRLGFVDAPTVELENG